MSCVSNPGNSSTTEQAATQTVAVLGGFERSGHDAAAEAVVGAVERRGHACTELRWRDITDLDQLLIFHLHRVGVRTSVPWLSAFSEDSAVVAALVDDLCFLLGDDIAGYDAVLSVHPWSTLVAAKLLADSGATLVDCHVEFSSFPITPVGRATWHTGTWAAKTVVPSVLRSLRTVGVPIRSSFVSGNKRVGSLAVNCGADGWFLDQVLSELPRIVAATRCDHVTMLIGTQSNLDERVLRSLAVDVTVVAGSSDVSAVLSESQFLLTKAGGAPVAEALGAGTIPILLDSGVPWEDEARVRLVAANAALDGESPLLSDDIQRERWRAGDSARLGQLCRSAADSISYLISTPSAARADTAGNAAVNHVLARAKRDAQVGILPTASSALLDALACELC